MNRKICVITGSRADYGLLRWVMQGILDDPTLRLQIIATGMHLSPEFALTYRQIEQDGFNIDRKIEILTSSDTAVGIAKSMGLGLISFAEAFDQLSPDLIVVLGDRFEILAATSAALVACIPVAHLHGGETTQGAFDEACRHSITKMSHLHFVATQTYKNRVIQLGEHPDTVFLVGGLGLDSIKRLTLLNRAELEESLNLKFGHKNLLITFHPVTLEYETAVNQLQELLATLSELKDTKLIFTYPNADTNGRVLIKMIQQYVADHKNSMAFTSLGQLRYLSCLTQIDAVVGNSSSGLIEAPSFKIGTINIGDRQRGREQAASVIDCKPKMQDITNALNRLYSTDFQTKLPDTVNPYGTGGASERIVEIIKNHDLNTIVKKKFFDIPTFNS